MADSNPRQQYLKRWAALKSERSTWDAHWRELTEYIQPRRGRFFQAEVNRGEKKHTKIINGTAGWAARTLAAGMMAGITSPARPWFRLTTPDPALAEFGSVRQWLHVVGERMRQAFARSNIYNGLHLVYLDIATPGTAVMHVEEDPERLMRAYVFPVGQYALATSARQRIDTIYREVSMTVGQVVERFGLKACSGLVQDLYRRREYDHWLKVLHVVDPNRGLVPGQLGPGGKPWKSCWMELEADPGTGLLGESGFYEFPAVAPRWSVTGEDVYGSSPGMEALGDAKALQLLERRKLQLVDKITDPPMRGPAALRGQRASLLPGDITYYDALGPGQLFEPSMTVPPQAVSVVELSAREHEQRVKRAYYADLWLMMAQGDGTQKTAREVAELHEEKMLQLGPVMERLEDELLDPLIDRAFGILLRAGQIPPPPRELQGVDLRVEYISVMAQAQKLLGTSSIERLASFVGNLAAARPSVLDKVDWDEVVDSYATALDVPPALVRPDEDVQALRQEEARAAQQQQAMEQAGALVQGAKVLSETDTQGNNALTQVLGTLGGVAGAQVGGVG